MPIFIIFVGIILIAAGINDKLTGKDGLVDLIKEDFSPSDNSTSFPVWAAAIVIAAAIGYNKSLRPFSNVLLAFIFVAIFVRQEGFINKLSTALNIK